MKRDLTQHDIKKARNTRNSAQKSRQTKNDDNNCKLKKKIQDSDFCHAIVRKGFETAIQDVRIEIKIAKKTNTSRLRQTVEGATISGPRVLTARENGS